MNTPTTTSAKAVARSTVTERATTIVLGLLAVLAGIVALVVSYGALGSGRAQRPLLDPEVVRVLTIRPDVSRALAILGGVGIFVLGLWLALRALRPERRPDIQLERSDTTSLTVTSNAIARAVQADAEHLDGVTKATARSVGNPSDPALRLSVWLREGSDLKAVWQELDHRVLTHARESLGRPDLPTAIRIELGTAERRRVS